MGLMKKDNVIIVASRIRQARVLAGLTQEKLAEIIGVSRTAIVRWESGETDPTMNHLIAMTKVLHVSADYLLGTDETDRVEKALMEMASTLEKLITEMQEKEKKK